MRTLFLAVLLFHYPAKADPKTPSSGEKDCCKKFEPIASRPLMARYTRRLEKPPTEAAWKDPVARENLHTALANALTYTLYSSFTAQPANCFTESAQMPGLHMIKPDCPLVKTNSHLFKSYRASHVYCAPNKSDPKLKCDYFALVLKPLDRTLAPIISFKGTTDFAEWKANVFTRGAGLVQDTIQSLSRPKKDDVGAGADVIEALLDLQEDEKSKKLIFSGHSLGGALSQSLAQAYTASLKNQGKPVPQIQLVTFNSLAGTSMLMGLQELLVKSPLPGQAHTLLDQMTRPFQRDDPKQAAHPNIRGRHFATVDDPLQVYNRVASHRNVGDARVVLLPSARAFHDDGSIERKISIEGHLMTSLVQDLNYVYSKPLVQVSYDLQDIEATSPEEFERIQRAAMRGLANDWGVRDSSRGHALENGEPTLQFYASREHAAFKNGHKILKSQIQFLKTRPDYFWEKP